MIIRFRCKFVGKMGQFQRKLTRGEPVPELFPLQAVA